MEGEPEFWDPENVSLSPGIPSIVVTNTKIMRAFFLDQILCPLNGDVL